VIDVSVARRYARALIGVAAENGRHEKIGEELSAMAAALSSAEARAVLTNPIYTQAQIRQLVQELGKRMKISPAFSSFLNLLVDRQRLTEIDGIARVYGELLDEMVGRVRAVVTSALPLSKDELARVRDALAAATRKAVTLETKTDASIVGGLVAQVGNVVWDGSLRTQLEKLRDELKQAPLERQR
jgi:F-type H+-transporting ATPase subunit delta